MNNKRDRYIKMMDYFKNNRAAYNALKFVYRILPLFIFAAYPVCLVFSFMRGIEAFLKALLVPAGVFALVTVLRKVIAEPRPYVRFGVEPVFAKDSKFNSMPSRHTASAFIISMAILRLNITTGIVFLAVSALIAASRVCAGVHYARDVAAGAGIAAVCGYIFLFLI